MHPFRQRVLLSYSATSIEEAIETVNKRGYTLLVQTYFALCGIGLGFVDNDTKLRVDKMR